LDNQGAQHVIADPWANDGNTLPTVDLATLEGRLTAAILELLENGEVGNDWPQRVAREVLLQLAAELTAHEQLAERSLALVDAVQFLTQEL
jgi:hypothetical protein